MKKIISVLVCMTLALSIAVAAFAVEPAVSTERKTYALKDYDLPTSRTKIDFKLDDVLSVSTETGNKNASGEKLVAYKNKPVVFTSTKAIAKMVLFASNNDSTISVAVSSDGVNWTVTHEAIQLSVYEQDIEIAFEQPATYIRIISAAKMMIQNITVDYVAADLPVAPSTPTTAPEAPTTAPEAPTTAPEAPTTAPQTPATQPGTPSTPVDPNGDNTFMVIALVALSMTALVVLVSKKRAF